MISLLSFTGIVLINLFTIPVQSFLYQTRYDNLTWDDAHWIISTTDLDQGHYQSRMSLGNGYLGINLAALGPFFDVDIPVNGDTISGWPLFSARQSFASISGFWNSQPASLSASNFPWLNHDNGHESFLTGIPHWSGLHLKYGPYILNASSPSSSISQFSTSLDLQNGLLNWTFTWTPGIQTPSFNIHYSMFVHKLAVNYAGILLSIVSSEESDIMVIDTLNGDGAVRSIHRRHSVIDSHAIWTSVSPVGLPHVRADVVSTVSASIPISPNLFSDPSIIGTNASSIAQSFFIHTSPQQPVTIEKHVGIASSDAFEDPYHTAVNASRWGLNIGFHNASVTHKSEWNSLMSPALIDCFRDPVTGLIPDNPDILDLQIMAVTNPFNILQNVISSHSDWLANVDPISYSNSVAVGGLGSDAYGGMIFWDADIWIHPALTLSYPTLAQQVTDYRSKLYNQAQLNTQTAHQSSQRNRSFSPDGAVYPWTSGRFGDCTGVGPCFDYQYHISGDIALAFLNQYLTSGDEKLFRTKYFPIFESIATFYADLVQWNASSSSFTIVNATDPDEYANHIDQPAYSLALIAKHLTTANQLRQTFNLPVNEVWRNISQNIKLPVNEGTNIILEYSSMNGSTVIKQADVMLIYEFLDEIDSYSLANLVYYAMRQSVDGPAMTYSVLSILANTIFTNSCASYTYELSSALPYARAPWYLFSEQMVDLHAINGGTHPAFPFLTGMGGSYRIPLSGYLGLKLLIDGIRVSPSLPPQIPNLVYRTFYWRGHPIQASSNSTHTTLIRSSYLTSLPNSDPRYSYSPIPVFVGSKKHVLSLDKDNALTIRNRASMGPAVENDILQCQPVFTSEAFESGRFPVAAVDGSAGTLWQPSRSDIPSQLTVVIPEIQRNHRIKSVYFDWSDSPPQRVRVDLSNSSTFYPPETVFPLVEMDIPISYPYDAEAANIVTSYIGNTTTIIFDNPVNVPKYARLTVMGNQNNPRKLANVGARVAQWALIKE